MSDEILVLGKIQGARGVRGDLRIIRRGDMLDNLKKNSPIELYRAQGIRDGFLTSPEFYNEYIMQNFAVLTPDTAQLRLKGIANADDAWSLKGFFIGIKLSEAKIKFHNPEDPYLFEYIGLDVFEGNEFKGKVKRVDEYNHKQWLIVDCLNSEVMIPLQGPYIEVTDFTRGINIVQDSGLFILDDET
ncbi:MAG: hypothetical protein OEV78_03950 [Spirochaetia bacterium]|nr:hypothetical protein [Spirochaetia bacterium]